MQLNAILNTPGQAAEARSICEETMDTEACALADEIEAGRADYQTGKITAMQLAGMYQQWEIGLNRIKARLELPKEQKEEERFDNKSGGCRIQFRPFMMPD